MGCKKMLRQEVWCHRNDLCPPDCNQSSSIFVHFHAEHECHVSDNRADPVHSGLFQRSENICSSWLSTIQATSSETEVREARAERESLVEEAGLRWTLRENGIWKDRGKRKTRRAFKERYSDMPRHAETEPT